MRPRPLRLHDPREFPVLYVDDEVDNLRIFELTFRREFSVLTAQSADEGLRILNENPVAVILSDHKMPGMTGVEFLSRVREIDEQAIRILVTAYGDASTLGSAINDGRIYRYVAKPWTPDDMRLTLRRAIERYALDRERDALLSELTLLNRLSRTLHRELRPERVVERLLGAAHRELGFDAVAVLLYGSDRTRLHWAGIAPSDDVAERVQRIALTRAAAPRFLESLDEGKSQTLTVEMWDELEAPVREWVAEVSADDLVVVPLPGEREVIGAIAIDNRSGGRRFGADDRTLLDGLSTQAVIALENARTVAALRSSQALAERMDRLGTLGSIALGVVPEMERRLDAVRAVSPEDEPHVARLRDIVATLAAVADEAGAGAVVEIAPGTIAREVAELLAGEASSLGIELRARDDAGGPKLRTSPAKLRQLLVDLARELVRSSERGARVEIVSGRAESRDAKLAARIELIAPRSSLRSEDVERALDPYSEPDERARESGMRLRIAHALARDLGGALEWSASDGAGFVLRIQLPELDAR